VTVIDVGVTIGVAVIWVGDTIAHGTVHAVEPIPATFAALEANVTCHVRLDVHLHAAGASNRARTAEFTFCPLTSTSSSMYPDDSAAAHAESRAFIRADIEKRIGFLARLAPASPPAGSSSASPSGSDATTKPPSPFPAGCCGSPT
jgi:FkbM family methyltransferase